MSEILFKACGLAVVSAMTVTLLKKFGTDFAVLLKVAAGIALGLISVSAVAPVVEYVRELSGQVMGGKIVEAAELMLRVLSVALITHFCANICRDCGEMTIASYLELGGKVEIILLSLPMVKSIIDLVVGML